MLANLSTVRSPTGKISLDIPSNRLRQVSCLSSQLPDCLFWGSTLAQLSGGVSQTSGRQLRPLPVGEASCYHMTNSHSILVVCKPVDSQ